MIKNLFTIIMITCYCMYGKNSMVVLDPASVEILYMIGAEDEILAIPDMKNIKPIEKTSKLTKVGTFTYPNVEKIISLKPKRVILTSYSIGLTDQLKRYNIETLQLPVTNLKDIYNNILTLGKLTNREEQAKKVATEFMQKIEHIKTTPINKSGVFIYSSTPLMVFGGDTLPSDVLYHLGITNIAQHVEVNKPIVNAEFLTSKNPDIILYGLRINNRDELLRANPSFKYLKAIKNNQIYFLEIHTLLRGSPNIIDEMLKIKNDFK